MKRIFKHPFVLSLLIIFSLIFINQRGWLNPVSNIFFKSSSLIQKNILYLSLKTNNFFNFIISIKNLNQENNKLKEDNLNLLSQLIELRETKEENEMLRDQIGLPLNDSNQLVLANIISKDSSDFGKYFLINKGRKDGIEEKFTVIASGNILVGQVTEVFNSFSKIRLITDPNSLINARIQDSEIDGLVRGEYNDLIFDLLPQGKEIEIGNMVITSSLSGLFPSGLIIGKIEKIISSDAQISQKAKISSVIDFNKLDKVFIIIQ